MILLGVNIDHVATLRQARGGVQPDILWSAKFVETAGADGITVHLREDRRHIQDADVYSLRKKIKTRLNLEMALSPDIISIACNVIPDQVTLVPEKRKELTTEGGLDVAKECEKIRCAIKKFHEKGIKVSLFVDPVIKQVRISREVGADAIELHTGSYAQYFGKKSTQRRFNRLCVCAEEAHKQGLVVNAGHGLDYKNTRSICRIPYLHEVNIGHSIVSRALFVGFPKAVKEMKTILRRK